MRKHIVSQLPLLALAAVLFAAGCHKDQANLIPVDSSDPASVNQASGDTGTAAYAPASGQPTAEEDNGVQPVATATEPPPPLPQYDQPPAPGDGYEWTPGYWNHASTGYYWVPGVWVRAPYVGALWTPGYWGYRHNRYEFFRGYWGPHVGYYGGVNYGYGYTGVGFRGGYWTGGHFSYNRAVANVDINLIHNVYTHPEPANEVRISFNGGSGGILVQPRPFEVVALREHHTEPLAIQVQHERFAGADREAFFEVNHGRPASVVVERPYEAERTQRVAEPPQMHPQPLRQIPGPAPREHAAAPVHADHHEGHGPAEPRKDDHRR